MKRSGNRRWMVAAIVAVGVLGSGAAQAASAESIDLDPSLSAKVGKERLKASNQALRSPSAGGPGGGDSSNCGQVDIGNTNGPKTGSQRLNQKEQTIVITGPVINAARCR